MARIVVIGGNGFIGKHTVRELTNLKKEVVVVDIINSENLPHGARFVSCDISSASSLKGIIKKNDKVLLLAAITRFEVASKYPFKTIATNVTGVVNIIQECIRQKAERLVFASSGSVYGVDAAIPITEKAACTPISLYGLSKKMGEELIFYYKKDLPFIILRYGYVYGQGKTWGAIGAFIQNLKEGKKPVIYGGAQTSDFVHVKDVVQANLLALESPHLNQVYNIGSGIPLSIREVYDICAGTLKSNIKPTVKPLRGWDFNAFVYDISKAHLLLKYTPKRQLTKGMSWKDMVG